MKRSRRTKISSMAGFTSHAIAPSMAPATTAKTPPRTKLPTWGRRYGVSRRKGPTENVTRGLGGPGSPPEERPHRLRHLVDLALGVAGRQGETQDLAHQALGLGQGRGSQVSHGGLLVGRHRVVDSGLDAAHGEEARQLPTVLSAADVEVVHVAGVLALGWQRQGQAR